MNTFWPQRDMRDRRSKGERCALADCLDAGKVCFSCSRLSRAMMPWCIWQGCLHAMLTPCPCLACIPLTCPPLQVFDPEKLLQPALRVEGNTLRVRAAGFTRNGALPRELLTSRALIRSGKVDCRAESTAATTRTAAAAANAAAAATTSALGAAGHLRELYRVEDEAANDKILKPPLCSILKYLSPTEQAHASASGVCAQQGLPPPALQVTVPRGLTSQELRTLMAPFGGVRWLHLADPVAIFKGFAKRKAAGKFQQLMDSVTVDWCCRAPEFKGQLPDGHFLRARPAGGSQSVCYFNQNGLNMTYFCDPGDPPLVKA